ETAVGAEIETSIRIRWTIGRRESQIRIERLRIDDVPRVHHAVGIKRVLEFAKRVDEFRAEHLRQQLRTRETVAMLAGQRSAELRNEICDIEHGPAENRDCGSVA